jgi:23S rRNA pseudouridine1911/1915/1917 synthase
MADIIEKIIIKDEKQIMRVDKFISQYLDDLSRTLVQDLIDNDDILVNQKSVKSSYKLKIGDVIEVFEYTRPSKEIIPVDLPIDIVYEDEDVLVVNKASGMVVHPAPGHYQDTLVNALMYHIDHLSDGSSNARPGIVHRIDKDTSGLLMVAKNNQAHEALSKELQKKKTKREYLALVDGVIKNKRGKINAPIGRDPHNRLKMAVIPNGKPAITHFEVLEQFESATLIKCVLETGRTHQIRVHMAYINHPLINDEVYGKKLDDFGQYLHAKTIGFTHPKTHKWMEFESDLPMEFKEYIKKIRD